jgi:hypothetical protein
MPLSFSTITSAAQLHPFSYGLRLEEASIDTDAETIIFLVLNSYRTNFRRSINASDRKLPK